MIWAILAALGVPLWLCAAGIGLLVFRNDALRRRSGNIPVRVRRAGKKRWSPGHAVWIHDVFAFRGLPAGWKEALIWAPAASAARPATDQERKKLHGIGQAPVIVTLTPAEGQPLDIAASHENAVHLLGPFAEVTIGDAESIASDNLR